MLSVIYYSDKHCSPLILKACLANLRTVVSDLHAELIVQIQDTPNVRSHQLMYQNILDGIAKANHSIVFLAEHDVMYSKWHFLERPNDNTTLFNISSIDLTSKGYIINNSLKLSQMSGRKLAVQKAIEFKLAQKEIVVAEPIDPPMVYGIYASMIPNIDIRHQHAFTGDRASDELRINDRYWGPAESFIRSFEL